MSDGHSFNNISLGGRSGTTPGQLKVHSGGIVWKKQGGGKTVVVDRSDLLGLSWMKVPRSNQLAVRTNDGLNYKFTGFRDQDVTSLSTFFESNFGKTPDEKQLSISGKNWGEVDFNADVAQTQLQGKTDVMLEFHTDDTTGSDEKDSLMEISFHIPNSNTQFIGDESHPSAQVFRDKIISMADVGGGGEEAVVTFDGIAILTPRGRYSVELHLSFLRLQGQASDFKIQYSSIIRVFWLPKSNQPHTYVIVTLDPPIRKGQTLYPHIVIQFETEAVIDTMLSMSDELYNSKYKDKLKPEHKGLVHEIFVTILRGLSGAKVTRPGSFRSHLNGYAVKSSLKAEDGVLYPLEKSFFFLPKPPTLILHDEIDYVEFERHVGSNMHYFDFLVRLKSEQEHLFRNIQRNEYQNLLNFVTAKNLRIVGTPSDKAEGVQTVFKNDPDDNEDPYVRIIKETVDDESDKSDEDFQVEKDDSGSPTDDSGEDDSDASDSADVKMVQVKKKQEKEPSSSKASSSGKQTIAGEGDGSKKKKKEKKEKDPNAPKRNMSAYMFFCKAERENLKKSGKSSSEIMQALGGMWSKLTAEERAPYEVKAQADKKRYGDQMSGYKNPQAANRGSVDATDSS